MRLHSEDTVGKNASGKWGILKGIEKEVECDKVYINETDGVYYKVRSENDRIL